MEIFAEDSILVEIFMESKNDNPNYAKALFSEDLLEVVKREDVGKYLKQLKDFKYINIDIIGNNFPLFDTLQITQSGIDRAKKILNTI